MPMPPKKKLAGSPSQQRGTAPTPLAMGGFPQSASALPGPAQSASAFDDGGALPDENYNNDQFYNNPQALVRGDHWQTQAETPAISDNTTGNYYPSTAIPDASAVVPGQNQGNPMPDTGHPETSEDIQNSPRYPNEQATPAGDRSASNQTNSSISDALDTVDQVMKYGYSTMLSMNDQSGAIPDTQAMRYGGEIAEGGEVADQDGEDTEGGQAQPQQQGGGQPNPQQIVGLVQGKGAMSTPLANVVEKQTGDPNPNTAKLKAVTMLANTSGPQAAWGYMQNLRKQYDVARTAAAVKANQGQLPQSTQAATLAMTNVLDGTDTRFQPAPNGQGVQVTVHKLGGGSAAPAKRFDDGGDVSNEDDGSTDDNQQGAIQDPMGSGAEDIPSTSPSDAGRSIYQTTLSIPQYLNLLMGKGGQFDQIHNAGTLDALTYAQSVSGAVNTQSAGAEQGGTEALAGVGNAIGQGIKTAANPAASFLPPNEQGTTQPPIQAANVPMPQPRPDVPQLGMDDDEPQAAGAGAGATPTTPATGNGQTSTQGGPQENDQQLLDRLQTAANRLFPWVGGQAKARNQWIADQYSKAKGYEAQQTNTGLLVGGRNEVAQTRAQGYVDSNTIKAAASTQNGQMRLQAALANAQRLGVQGMNNNAARVISAQISSGQQLTEQQNEWLANVLNEAQRQQQQYNLQNNNQGPTAPTQIQTQGNPNAQQPQQRQTVYVNNKPYYVDASGKVLGPAQ